MTERQATHEFEGRLVTRQELRHELEQRFRPLRPASKTRLLLAAFFGPLLWTACVLLAVFVVQPTHEILLGALVSVACLVSAAVVLLLMRRGRVKEERGNVGPA
jgi:hypothetical protein